MKRKVMMMSLAMAAGLPHALYAKGGGDVSEQAYSFSNAAYMPHYGAEGASKPLMDHISVAGPPSAGETGDAWRLELTPPEAVSTADTPLTASDKRVGFTFKLGF